MSHFYTVINEGNGYSVMCSCGWQGETVFQEKMSAAMAWAMDHAQKVCEAGPEVSE